MNDQEMIRQISEMFKDQNIAISDTIKKEVRLSKKWMLGVGVASIFVSA